MMSSLKQSARVAGVMLAAALGSYSVTQAQSATAKVMPDAQIEAGVLKALAGAPELANQAITTTTVYGVVTLSGSVQTEAQRTEAEKLASITVGVKKVVDEMTLGAASADAQSGQAGGSAIGDGQETNPNLQSDGTIAQAGPDSDNTASSPNQASGPVYGPGAPEYRRPYNGQSAPPANSQQQGYPQQSQGYPPPQGYPQSQGYPQQPRYNAAPQPIYGGQEGGQTVTVPTGALVRLRINQALDSSHVQPGQHFSGVVVNDVVADGAVAIPRGAAVEGNVVDAKASGALKGRGELSLQLTQITLGGRVYPLTSDLWTRNGADKTVQTVNNTAVGTGLGALFGAAAAGGKGAAIGAGLGAALGLGSSAASGGGQVHVPSEGLLSFRLAQPATVTTVSQLEMDRLAQGIGQASNPQRLQRRYPPVYYGPAYYRPYPYPY